MKYGTGAPGHTRTSGLGGGFSRDFVKGFLGRFLLFLEARPPKKTSIKCRGCMKTFPIMNLSGTNQHSFYKMSPSQKS